MIANPSFETLGRYQPLAHQRHAAPRSLGTTVPTDVAPGGGPGAVHTASSPGRLRWWSSRTYFPLDHYATVRDLWTIQAMVRGTGKVRVGLVGWEDDFAATASTGAARGVGHPAHGLAPPLRPASQLTRTSWGLVRIECSGGEMHLDNVLCEPDWLTRLALLRRRQHLRRTRRLLVVRRGEPQGPDLLLLVQPPSCRRRAALRLGHPDRRLHHHRRGGREPGLRLQVDPRWRASHPTPRRAVPRRHPRGRAQQRRDAGHAVRQRDQRRGVQSLGTVPVPRSARRHCQYS